MTLQSLDLKRLNFTETVYMHTSEVLFLPFILKTSWVTKSYNHSYNFSPSSNYLSVTQRYVQLSSIRVYVPVQSDM